MRARGREAGAAHSDPCTFIYTHTRTTIQAYGSSIVCATMLSSAIILDVAVLPSPHSMSSDRSWSVGVPSSASSSTGDIGKIEATIDKVEREIQRVEQQIDDAERRAEEYEQKGDTARETRWRNEKDQLRTKEAQLRKEKELLLKRLGTVCKYYNGSIGAGVQGRSEGRTADGMDVDDLSGEQQSMPVRAKRALMGMTISE